jgi:16S rRNA (guanine527-N7)-methyltransferase
VPDTDRGADSPTTVASTLEEAQRAGFLGPGPVEPHLRHAEGFALIARRLLDEARPAQATTAQGTTAQATVPARLLDLGSGGGLPGLVVAEVLGDVSVVLLDANSRRTGFLGGALIRLGLAPRVSVTHARAELAGRDPLLRGAFDAVVVRSFGPPAVVAECAAPFLRPGGWLIVSEPPGDPGSGPIPHPERWPAPALSELGLEPSEFVAGEFGYQVLRQVEPCPDRFPRRDGVPAKNPLF